MSEAGKSGMGNSTDVEQSFVDNPGQICLMTTKMNVLGPRSIRCFNCFEPVNVNLYTAILRVAIMQFAR